MNEDANVWLFFVPPAAALFFLAHRFSSRVENTAHLGSFQKDLF